MVKPLIITFYTDNKYQAGAYRLVDMATERGFDTYIEQLPDKGDWMANCRQKGPFVDRVMKEQDRPLLWVDADATADDINLDKVKLNCDFAAHKSSGHRKWISSVLYFNNTVAAKRILETWSEQSADGVGTLCSDMYYLDLAWRMWGIATKARVFPKSFMTPTKSGSLSGNAGRWAKRINNRVSGFKMWWSKTPVPGNFGDILSPFMFERETGQRPAHAKPNTTLAIGSTIRLARPGATVWGSGVMAKSDAIEKGISFVAVRGPVTQAEMERRGLRPPSIIGDPGLLLPLFYYPKRTKSHQVGLVHHYVHREEANRIFKDCPILKIIDPIRADIKDVVDEMLSCEMIASSSLHGLVTAEAYGLPHLWVTFPKSKRQLDPDGSKFEDFHRSLKEKGSHQSYRKEPIEIVDFVTAARMFYKGKYSLPMSNTWQRFWDLWKACPFSLENLTRCGPSKA